MLIENLPKIMSQIGERDIVLDIGGWAQPFARADYVIDIMPYETRGMFGTLGGTHERFTRETWLARDICDREPFPFPNKSIDFAICSHVLEDCRDPVFVCSEIDRIARKGYIEVPSRRFESTIGLSSRRFCGYSHHRWLVEIDGDEVTFIFKSHLMSESWKYHLPCGLLKSMTETDKVSVLFWDGSFRYRERIAVYPEDQVRELTDFVERAGVYHPLRYRLDGYQQRFATSAVANLLRRIKPRI